MIMGRRPRGCSGNKLKRGGPGLRNQPGGGGKYRRLAGLFAALVLISPPAGYAGEEPPPEIRLKADELIYDHETETMEAVGNVRIRRKDLRLTADRVRFRPKTSTAAASGNVVLSIHEEVLTGERIEVDLVRETGTIYNGTLISGMVGFIVRGKRIQKTGDRIYAAKEVAVTACEGPVPDWEITCDRLKLKAGGYGTARGAAFRIRKIPVLWSPFMIFPVKKDRQSGFLLPEPGLSDRLGTEVLLPFFWAISESKDMTLYFHHLSKRGEKVGAEFRFAASRITKGVLQLDGFADRRLDQGTVDTGYTDDTWLRTNTDRYWFRMKSDLDLPAGIIAAADLDVVSDPDYLMTFQEGMTGFHESRRAFRETFGRDLTDPAESYRQNSLRLHRNDTAGALEAGVDWYDHAPYRRYAETNPTLQRLPYLDYQMPRRRLSTHLPLETTLHSRYERFYREDGPTGHRGSLSSALHLPVSANAVSFDLFYNLKETVWSLDKTDTPQRETGRLDHRYHYTTGVSAKTRLFRDFSIDAAAPGSSFAKESSGETAGEGLVAIRHDLIPEIEYAYAPVANEEADPYYTDSTDTDPFHRITLSLTNHLIGRFGSRNASPGDANVKRRLVYCKIDGVFDIREATSSKASKKSFREINMTLYITPEPRLRIFADGRIDPHSGDITERNYGVGLSNIARGNLRIEHRYTKEAAESLKLTADTTAVPALHLFGTYERNLAAHETLETRIGAVHHAGCWSVGVEYAEQKTDRRFLLRIGLKGLGGLGTSP